MKPHTDTAKALRWLPAATAIALLTGCQAMAPLTGDGRNSGVFENITCQVSPSSCATLIVPPRLVEAGGLRQVAVSAGSGTGAASVATQLESALSSVRVDDKPYYTIVPANDPAREGLFEVNVTTWAVSDDRETQSRFTKSGDRKVERKISCTVRKATVGTLIRLRDRKGKILATRETGGIGTSTQCAGEPGTLATAPEVLGVATTELMKKVQDELTVRTITKPIKMLDDTAGIDPGNVERFKSALDFAKSGRLDRACPMLEELSESETRSVSVFHNAGFCSQVKGDWRQAYTLYAKADSASSKPMDDLRKVLEETRAYSVQKK